MWAGPAYLSGSGHRDIILFLFLGLAHGSAHRRTGPQTARPGWGLGWIEWVRGSAVRNQKNIRVTSLLKYCTFPLQICLILGLHVGGTSCRVAKQKMLEKQTKSAHVHDPRKVVLSILLHTSAAKCKQTPKLTFWSALPINKSFIC